MQILDPESTLVKYSAYEYVLLASWKYFDKVSLIVQLVLRCTDQQGSLRLTYQQGTEHTECQARRRAFITNTKRVPTKCRVTHHVDSNLSLTSNQKFRFGLAELLF